MSNNSNPVINLRQAGQKIREALTCAYCGGSVLVAATGWKGRGTGQRGSADYRATSYQTLAAANHCTCPDGPMWSQLAQSELGRDFRIVEGQRKIYYDPYGEQITSGNGRLIVWDSEEETWMWISADAWRQAVMMVEQDDPAMVRPSNPGIVWRPDAQTREEGAMRAIECAFYDMGNLVDALRRVTAEAYDDREKRQELFEHATNYMLSWGWQTHDVELAIARYYPADEPAEATS